MRRRFSASTRSFSRALGLEPLPLAPLGLLGLAALGVPVLRVQAVLFLEHIALHVGAAAPHLDIDGAGTTLRARQLQFALGLALQRDLVGRAAALLIAAVRLAQVRQQFEFGLVADAIIGPFDLDACLIELHDQPVHRYFQHLGKLRNSYISHQ